jgi:putative ABC transport system permease protein
MPLKQSNYFSNNGQRFFLIKPFDYFFLDEYFNRQYQKEEQLQKVFGYLSAIGLGIACLGLFGFTYFMTYQRTKEIGIRKTLGATMLTLSNCCQTEFAIVLLLAGVVAFPLSYYAGEFMVVNLSRKDLA